MSGKLGVVSAPDDATVNRTRLQGKRVAVVVEDLFEAREVTEPRERLRAEGAEVVLVGPFPNREYRDTTGEVRVTSDLGGSARARDFDAVVIPGGYAPDKLRMRHALVDLVADAVTAGKPVAAICRGAQLLISANALRGRTVTCWPSIAVDVKNAGGLYVDRPVVRDGNLITSRKPDDLPVFLDALVEALAPSGAVSRERPPS